jgi:hypothetical protein
MFDSRASLPNEVKSDIEQFLRNARGTNSAWSGACMLPTFIRRNIKLAEAPSYGKTIFEYEQNCNGAEDYRKVGEYIYSQSFELPKPESTESDSAVSQIEQPEQSVQQDSEFQSESQVENVSNPEPVTEPVPSGEDITQTDNQFQESQEFPPQENQQENQVPEYAEPGGRENQPEDQTQQYQESPSGENRENPPIEIREIPPSTDSQPWREFVQAPTEPHESEADTSEHKQTGQ